MMKVRLQLFLVALLALTSSSVLAQQIVSGQVTDGETGEPLPGATVALKGTTIGVITDFDGNYTLEVPGADAVLQYSFIGYMMQEVVVGNQTVINILLTINAEQLEEIVVMGYYSQAKEDITGSVSVVDAEAIKAQPNANVVQSLQGQATGVTVVSGGDPGSNRNQIRIRGTTTLNNNNPLYVVDGIPTVEALDNLNPNDIESIQVLKDAAAASIYGSRSAGGVIVITTKKGQAGKLKIDGGMVFGFQQPVNQVEMLNANEWGRLYWDATFNTIGIYPSVNLYGGVTDNPAIIENVPFTNSSTDQLYEFTGQGTNWANEVYRTAKNNQYYLNLTTGSERGTIGVGFSYFDQEGMITNTFYERITARVNSEIKIVDWVKLGENLNVSRSIQSQTGTQDTQNGIPYQVIRQHPALPIYDTDGNFAGGNTTIGGLAFPNSINPVAELDRQKGNTSDSWRIFGNVYLNADVFEPIGNLSDKHSLSLKTNLGVDYSNFFNDIFAPSFEEGGFNRPDAVYNNTFGDGLTLTWINTAEYTFKTKNHDVRVLGGMEAISYQFRDLSAGRSGYILEDDNYVQIGSGADSTSTNNGGRVEWGLRSFFGRADYSFKDRYLLGATVRYDQTSRLTTSGTFPAFSFGWNLHNEDFAASMFAGNFLYSLKARASWGQQGNQAIGPYDIYSTFGLDNNRADYDLNGNNNSVISGLITRTRGNTDAVWETTTQSNFGIDASFLNNRMLFSAEYYMKHTADILATPVIPAVAGEGVPPVQNTATVDNTGFEFTLRYNDETETAFTYDAELQFSYNKNNVVDLGAGVGAIGYEGEQYLLLDGESRAATGHPYASFYGWQTEGIFQTAEEVTDHPNQGLGAGIGRLKFKDLNGDNVINDQDRTYLGDPFPDVTLGLNLRAGYKGFSLNMFFYSALGHQIYNYTRQNTDFFEPNFNVGRRILDAWSETNKGSEIPMPVTIDTNNERRASDYFVENADYFRLKILRFGYQLPSKWTKDLGINIYAEMQNVFTVTGYTGLDPEVPFAGNANVFGIDRGIYPIPRTILFGINFNL